jgi:hypothetical protein
MHNIETALKVILARSQTASHEALGALRAFQKRSPMATSRANRAIKAAVEDADAGWTEHERMQLADLIAEPDDAMLNVRLTTQERDDLKRRADAAGLSLSAYVRARLFE